MSAPTPTQGRASSPRPSRREASLSPAPCGSTRTATSWATGGSGAPGSRQGRNARQAGPGAAIFAEFEGDPAALEFLEQAVSWGRPLEHAAQRLRTTPRRGCQCRTPAEVPEADLVPARAARILGPRRFSRQAHKGRSRTPPLGAHRHLVGGRDASTAAACDCSDQSAATSPALGRLSTRLTFRACHCNHLVSRQALAGHQTLLVERW